MKKNYTKYVFTGITALLISLSANAQSWNGQSEAWSQGEGTAESPYLIENASHLAWLSEQVKAGQTFENKHFKLTCDLDMGKTEGQTFPVIGKFNTYLDTETMETVDNSKYFKGIFDGDYHTIDNLQIEYVDNDLGGTGLFACSTSGTIIKNLIIGEHSTISGGLVCGAFVGQMNGGLITNCANKANVQATNFHTGGIVGVIENGEITSCFNAGTISGTTELGGIIGQGAVNALVSYCYNIGEIKASGFGGGGIGGALYDQAVIRNCYNIGHISGDSSPWLGSPHAIISDMSQTSSTTDCYYVQEMSGVDDKHATARTSDEMKSQATVDALNAGSKTPLFVVDASQINQGMPVLHWQTSQATGINNCISETQPDVNVNGRQITSAQFMHIYDLSGRLVMHGYQAILEPGCYVVQVKSGSTKIIIH